MKKVFNLIKKNTIPYRLNNRLKDLSSNKSAPLRFHNIKDNDEVKSSQEALRLLRSGQVLVVMNLLNKYLSSNLVNEVLGFDIEEIEQIHKTKDLAEIKSIIQNCRSSILTLELQTRIISNF